MGSHQCGDITKAWYQKSADPRGPGGSSITPSEVDQLTIELQKRGVPDECKPAFPIGASPSTFYPANGSSPVTIYPVSFFESAHSRAMQQSPQMELVASDIKKARLRAHHRQIFLSGPGVDIYAISTDKWKIIAEFHKGTIKFNAYEHINGSFQHRKLDEASMKQLFQRIQAHPKKEEWFQKIENPVLINSCDEKPRGDVEAWQRIAKNWDNPVPKGYVSEKEYHRIRYQRALEQFINQPYVTSKDDLREYAAKTGIPPEQVEKDLKNIWPRLTIERFVSHLDLSYSIDEIDATLRSVENMKKKYPDLTTQVPTRPEAAAKCYRHWIKHFYPLGKNFVRDLLELGKAGMIPEQEVKEQLTKRVLDKFQEAMSDDSQPARNDEKLANVQRLVALTGKAEVAKHKSTVIPQIKGVLDAEKKEEFPDKTKMAFFEKALTFFEGL